MERFKLINELAVAGENFARMNLNQRKLKSVGSKLDVVPHTFTGKTAVDWLMDCCTTGEVDEVEHCTMVFR